MRVIYLPVVLDYFNELTSVLYKENYFGFEDDAFSYVDELIDDIERNIFTTPHKIAPFYFERYGKSLFYASFRKNKHTIWYVFFSKHRFNNELTYVIRYINNNHFIAQLL